LLVAALGAATPLALLVWGVLLGGETPATSLIRSLPHDPAAELPIAPRIMDTLITVAVLGMVLRGQIPASLSGPPAQQPTAARPTAQEIMDALSATSLATRRTVARPDGTVDVYYAGVLSPLIPDEVADAFLAWGRRQAAALAFQHWALLPGQIESLLG